MSAVRKTQGLQRALSPYAAAATSACPAPPCETDLDSAALTAKQEAFAQAFMETGNKSAALRAAYGPDPAALPQTIWTQAHRVAANPNVALRIKELQQQAAINAICNASELMRDWYDIATADPAELVRNVARCCRYCHGEGHGYQWKSEDEYLAACVAALDAEKAAPGNSGGYGYVKAAEPAETCPECLGRGIEEVIQTDTTKLTGKAKKLYAGMDFKGGQWVVRLHCQQKARESLARMLGAFIDKSEVRTVNAPAADKTKLPENVTPETAAKAYLQLVG